MSNVKNLLALTPHPPSHRPIYILYGFFIFSLLSCDFYFKPRLFSTRSSSSPKPFSAPYTLPLVAVGGCVCTPRRRPAVRSFFIRVQGRFSLPLLCVIASYLFHVFTFYVFHIMTTRYFILWLSHPMPELVNMNRGWPQQSKWPSNMTFQFTGVLLFKYVYEFFIAFTQLLV